MLYMYIYNIYIHTCIYIYYVNHLYPLIIFAEVRNCSSGCTFLRMDCCPTKVRDGLRWTSVSLPTNTASRMSDQHIPSGKLT